MQDVVIADHLENLIFHVFIFKVLTIVNVNLLALTYRVVLHLTYKSMPIHFATCAFRHQGLFWHPRTQMDTKYGTTEAVEMNVVRPLVLEALEQAMDIVGLKLEVFMI